MSHTPEYYFKRRWNGLEGLAKIIGDRTFSGKRDSVDLSLGEQFQDLVMVVASVLACSSEIRDALSKNRIGEDELHHEVSLLERRVDQAVATLKEGVSEIVRMKIMMLIELKNHKERDK